MRIHYNDQGSGAPVVLLHGYAMNQANTARTGLVERLVTAGYRVLAVDARGHGQSGKPHAPSAYGAEMARDVVRLLDHLKLAQAHLVGYSMGAIVANKVRELYPERLKSVVLGGAGWQKEGDYALADLKGSDIAEALERTGSFEEMLRRFSAKQVPPPTNEEIGARNLRMVEGNDLKALAAVMRAWDGSTVPERNLRQNSVPTRAIFGALDPLKAKVDGPCPGDAEPRRRGYTRRGPRCAVAAAVQCARDRVSQASPLNRVRHGRQKASEVAPGVMRLDRLTGRRHPWRRTHLDVSSRTRRRSRAANGLVRSRRCVAREAGRHAAGACAEAR